MNNSTAPQIIAPQKGKQTLFMSTPADIAIYGGGAGGGKTFAAILESIRHIKKKGFSVVFFRRSYRQIRDVGGAWDEATKIFPALGGRSQESRNDWIFPPYNNRVSFRYLESDKDLISYQGTQIPLIIFDQLEEFSERQFFFMLSRNRSTCGVKPYVRATTNPDPDSFMVKLLGWWIDEEGNPINERAGIIRYFVIDPNSHQETNYIWADNRQELIERFPDMLPKSFTFIPALVQDNKFLMEKDPQYLSNLMSLPPVDRARLLHGNWKARYVAGKVFKREWFNIVDPVAVPKQLFVVRFWDLAATEADFRVVGKATEPCYTASVKMGIDSERGDFWVLDATEKHWSPGETNNNILNIATQDGFTTWVRWEIEGGASGKRDNYELSKKLQHFNANGVRPRGDKLTRAKPLSQAAYNRRVHLVKSKWNDRFINRLAAFPDAKIKDLVDAASGAFYELTANNKSPTYRKTQYNFTTF